MDYIKDPSKIKEAMTCLRAAKWGMTECKKVADMMKSVMKLPFEFSDENLAFLNFVFEGLSYLAMFRAFCKNESFSKDQAKMASLSRQIHVCFSKAKSIADEIKTIRSYHEQIIPDVYYNYYKFGYDACALICEKLLMDHEVEVTKGYNGMAISYMNQINVLMHCIDKERYLKKEDKQQFEMMYKKAGWDARLSDTVEKNNKIYKSVVPKSGEKNCIPEWENVITDKAPLNIYLPPDGYQHFQYFLSEELEKINSNLMLYVQNRKQFLQKLYYDINTKKEQVYREKNINFILSANSLQAAKLDDDFFINLGIVTKDNGGLAGYEKLKNNMNNEKSELSSVLGQIDQKIMQTKKDDTDFVNTLKNQGNQGMVEYVTFDAGNRDLVNNILGIHTNKQQYDAMEQPIGPDYQNFMSWLVKFSDTSVNWNDYTKQNEAAAYISDHQNDIAAVVKADQLISQIIRMATDEYNELNSILGIFYVFKVF